MRKQLTITCTLLTVALLAGSAPAAVTMTYDGSFDVASGYYGKGLAFVPDGVGNGDRPVSVTGPTVLTTSTHSNGFMKEWYIPALLKTGPANSATQVTTANGGTYVDVLKTLAGSNNPDSLAVMGSNIWAMQGYLGDGAIGLIKMGTNEVWSAGNTGVSRVQPTGYTAKYGGGGLADKWDETDTLLSTSWYPENPDPDNGVYGSRIYVSKAAKGDPTVGDANVFDWTVTSDIFNFWVSADDYNYDLDSDFDIEYVEVGGTKYYVMSSGDTHADSAKLMFFNASTTGDDATPDFTIDVSSDIAGGVGWFHSTNGGLKDFAYDKANNQLYLFDTTTGVSPAGGRIHVFTLVPEPATMGLLGLGFAGMAALRRRRRNAS